MFYQFQQLLDNFWTIFGGHPTKNVVFDNSRLNSLPSTSIFLFAPVAQLDRATDF